MATEDKIIILIEAVDKTNTVLADLQKRLGGVKNETMSFGKLLGGVTLGNVLSNQIENLTHRILSAAKATLTWAGDMETFGLSITSSLVTGGKYVDQMSGKALSTASAFGIAREAAKGILQELQAANLQTIATLDQLTRVYVETLPIALQKGFNTGQVKDFTLAVVQAAGAIGLEMDMIAEETRAMLTPSINPRFSRVAVALGLTNEDIRQHSQNAETLFSFLMQRLEGFRLAGEMTQRTWKGLWSNLKDIGLQAGAQAMEPIFLAVKASIEGILAGVIRVNAETKKIEWNPSFLQTIEKARKGFENILWLMEKISSFGGLTKDVEINELKDILKLRGAGGPGELATDKQERAGGINASFFRKWLQIGVTEESLDNDRDKMLWKKYKGLSTEQLETALEFENTRKGVQARSGYEKLRKPDLSDQYSSMLSIAGTAFNLDPNFIKSVMMAESDGNANAVSPKGALGLMQIMPQNVDEFLAKVIAKVPAIGERADKFPSKDIAAMDPLINIMMGSMYLRENFNKQGVGDIPGTLAAYNMGPGNYAKYQKGIMGMPDETEKYIAKVGKNYEKYGGTNLFDEQQLAYKGNEQMSKADVEIAKANYDAKLKLADNYTQTQTRILDSGAKLQLALLEADYAAGITSEEDYYDKKNAITQNKLAKELELIDKQSEDVYENFKKGMMTNLSTPTDEAELGVFKGIFGDEADVEAEKTKVIAKMTDLATKRQTIIDEMAISDAQEEKRKSQLSLKTMEINNREAESYEKTSNTIITEIEKIKVRYNDMLPGDALVAEHQREMKALENHIKHLSEEIEKTPLGGVAWTKKMDAIVGANTALAGLKAKSPYVDKESGFANEAQKLQNIATQLQATGQIADLNADMETLAKVQLGQTVNSLQEMAEKLKTIGDTNGAAKIIEMVNVLQARGTGAFAGIIDGLNEVTRSIGSTQTQFARLTSGIGQEIRGSLSSGIYDYFKGNIDINKGSKLSNVTGQLGDIEAQRQSLQLKKEQISANDALSESEKKAQQLAIDGQLKQLDAQQQLLNAQKTAIENSKSGEEILQGFLDRVTAKLADFMADEIVADFMGFLTGKTNKDTGKKEGGFVDTIKGWWDSIRGVTKSGMDDTTNIVDSGWAGMGSEIEAGGASVVTATSSLWSQVGATTTSWLTAIGETIYEWAVSIAKYIASVWSSWKGGGGGGVDYADAASNAWDIASDYWHKGGFVDSRYHKGGFIPKYHMGGLAGDEMPIIAKKGEYVLSREDVDFVNKVKSSGPSITLNMGSGASSKPTIVPMGITVMVDNASSVALQASSQTRQAGDANYIIDVVLRDINTRGKLARLGR